jgi:hypothetical protein
MAQTELRLIAEKRPHMSERLRLQARTIALIGHFDEMIRHGPAEVIHSGARLSAQIPTPPRMLELREQPLRPHSLKTRPGLAVAGMAGEQLTAQNE